MPVARGLVNYDADELPGLLGRSTRDLARELGAAYEREVVHRDDLVLLPRCVTRDRVDTGGHLRTAVSYRGCPSRRGRLSRVSPGPARRRGAGRSVVTGIIGTCEEWRR